MLKEIIERLMMNIIPVRKNLWIFGAWGGKLYSDNSKYMMEYVINNHPEIKCIWISQNNDVIKSLKEKGICAYHKKSIKGVLSVLRAQVIFETEGNQDISQLVNPYKTKVIQLWHGVGAKACNWKDNDGNLEKKDCERNSMFNQWYWMFSSDFNEKTMSEVYGLTNKERHFVTGYPRSDLIKNGNNEDVQVFLSQFGAKKKILYMPTHRSFGNNSTDISKFEELNTILKSLNYIMIYKPHIHEYKNIKNDFSFSNIYLADNRIFSDANSYLAYFDALVTDYSSVAYDFLTINKPIILFPYDYEEYITNDSGLLDYYFEIPLGPICYSWETLFNEIKNLNANNYEKHRLIAKNKFHPYDDGKNRERVFNCVKEIIENGKNT